MISWFPLTKALGRLPTEPPLRSPTLDCSNLKSLELNGYPFMFPNVPSLLSTVLALEILRIICYCEVMKEVVLEHARVCDLVIENCDEAHGAGMGRDIIVEEFELTLRMSRLLQANIEKSSVRVLKVAAQEKGIVKYIIGENNCNVVVMGWLE